MAAPFVIVARIHLTSGVSTFRSCGKFRGLLRPAGSQWQKNKVSHTELVEVCDLVKGGQESPPYAILELFYSLARPRLLRSHWLKLILRVSIRLCCWSSTHAVTFSAVLAFWD